MFRRFRRVVRPLMGTSMATMFQYRGEVVLWALWGVIFPAVSLTMWSAAAGGREMGGFAARDFAAYFLLTMILGHFTASWDVFEMGYLVQSGGLSPKLLRPMLPIWESISDNLAYKVVNLIVLVPIWIGVAWWTRPRFETRAVDLALGIPAVVLAMALSYLWGYILSMLAFVITKVEAIADAYFGLTMFLGGRFAPLRILPASLGYLTWLFPFRWTISFPIELLMGKLSVGQALFGLAMQGVWMLVAVMVFRWAWRNGLKRYSAVGA